MGLFGPRKFSILIADDEANIRGLLQEVLSMSGYEVSAAENGLAALSMIKEGDFDLVILDVHMPEMEGVQVLETLRSLPAYKSLPVIMMTSESMMGTINQAFQLKVNEYILKPFSPKDLLAKVAAHLKPR